MFSNCLADYSKIKLPPLHEAAAVGNFNLSLALLQEGHNVHEIDKYMGASPLHYAVQSGSIEVVKLFLDNGAYLNLQSATHGMTPLMVAVWHRKVSLVAYLLKQPGINTEIIATFGIKARDIIGFGLKSKVSAFDVEEEQVMHDLFANSHSKPNPIFDIILNNTLDEELKIRELHKVLQYESAKAVLNDTLPINCSGNDAHTPLLIAARDGMALAVKLLLEHGADQTIVDHYMRSLPIHKAAFSGHANVIKVLLEDKRIEAVINAQGPFNGYTPLHDAVWHGHYAAAKELIDAGAKTNLKGHDGNTAKDLALLYGYEAIFELF